MRPCRACGGQYLYGLTWKHPTTCPLYELDSATAAADHDRGEGVRPMTETEAALTSGVYLPPPEGWELGVRFDHSGVHRREVVVVASNGFNRPAERRDEGADDV